MKILAALLVIFALANSALAYSTAAFIGSSFNSTPIRVYDATSATANSSDTPWYALYDDSILFGAGMTNDTIYVWGLTATSTALTSIRKRTINATIAAQGNDTTLRSVESADVVISFSKCLSDYLRISCPCDWGWISWCCYYTICQYQ